MRLDRLNPTLTVAFLLSFLVGFQVSYYFPYDAVVSTLEAPALALEPAATQTPPITPCPVGQHHEPGCVDECNTTWWNEADAAAKALRTCVSAATTLTQMNHCVDTYDATMAGANARRSECISGCPCVPD